MIPEGGVGLQWRQAVPGQRWSAVAPGCTRPALVCSGARPCQASAGSPGHRAPPVLALTRRRQGVHVLHPLWLVWGGALPGADGCCCCGDGCRSSSSSSCCCCGGGRWGAPHGTLSLPHPWVPPHPPPRPRRSRGTSRRRMGPRCMPWRACGTSTSWLSSATRRGTPSPMRRSWSCGGCAGGGRVFGHCNSD